jgi:succinate dehydrogenase flavin-adding protein (antitoxin of CptAB toxin-antitoxin module)
MEMATDSQIKKLHVLFRNLDLMDDKPTILTDLTAGRTTSTKELTIYEAQFLIKRLCEYLPCEKLKSAIARLAWQAGIIYGNSETDKILNRFNLDAFLKAKGTVKKELQKQSYEELIKTHRQFEAIAKNNSRLSDKKAAAKAVRELLKELDLQLVK